jgi:DNA-directed RNA polymerase specialized sigma24 family protein
MSRMRRPAVSAPVPAEVARPAAAEHLPARQREVFVLCHLGDHTPRDVSMMTGMRESTVRVHLFRAVHKLRAALEAWRDLR